MKVVKIIFWLSLLGIFGCNDAHTDSAESSKLVPGTPEYKAESERVMNTIHEEYKAYFIKDYEAWKDKFIQEDYLKYWGYWEGYPEKVRQYNSWEELDVNKRKRMTGEVKAYWDENAGMDVKDLNIQIRGDVAWVTFKQISRDQKTGEYLGEALETKILEKENGEWKIAYLNFLYLPTEEEGDEN